MAKKSLIEDIAEDAVAPIGQVGGKLLVKASILLLTLAGAGVGAGFLTSALDIVLEQSIGRLWAFLVIGGAYLAVAIVLATAVAVEGHVSVSAAARAPSSEAGKSEASDRAIGILGMAPPKAESLPVAAAGSTGGSNQSEHPLDRLAAPILKLLHEEGMDRERLALAAGMTVAKELRPWMLVGVMLTLGVVLGHFTRPARPVDPR